MSCYFIEYSGSIPPIPVSPAVLAFIALLLGGIGLGHLARRTR